MIETEQQKLVDAAITSRRSIRAFLPKRVAREDIEAILKVAMRAPSGSNIQPWKVYVLTGATKEKLSAEILRAYHSPDICRRHTAEYHYYPQEWMSPYIDRRRKTGWGLYSLLNITRDNKAGMQAQHARNYVFFDAPVGLLFTIDRRMELGSWFDYGMFVQNIMVAARGRGLDTCPQVAFIQFHKIIGEVLQLPDSEKLVCGMSLGFADRSKIENTLVTEREPLSNVARFMD
jgi:nitroreductase